MKNWICTDKGVTGVIKRLVTERSCGQWSYTLPFRRKSVTWPKTTASSAHQKELASTQLKLWSRRSLISFVSPKSQPFFRGNTTKAETISLVRGEQIENWGTGIISIFSASSSHLFWRSQLLSWTHEFFFPFSKKSVTQLNTWNKEYFNRMVTILYIYYI